MRLRPRLALTLALAALPALGGLLVLRKTVIQRFQEQGAQEQIVQDLITGDRSRLSPPANAAAQARRMEVMEGREHRLIIGNAAVCAWLLLCALAAAGPIVRRIRSLAADVRRSAASRYSEQVPVQGDDELADLARAFNQASGEVRAHLAALEASEKTLRSFVANTTHDVMLPLTVLQGHLVSLRKQFDRNGPPPELIAALEESHYLASLVHNLGVAAKLDAGEPEAARCPVDLAQVVPRVVGRHRPIARECSIEVELAVPEEPLFASGDVTLIEQAISNVVHNAVRYNRPGGHVAVVLEARASGRAFSLRVIDDGPGVPDNQLARLSERHYRGDAARGRRPEGCGLGLHIAQEVAQRHGFELRIGRSEYGGLEVEFTGPSEGALPGD